MSKTNDSWASAIPPAQGLYLPEYEKDACGVGFVVHIKGQPSHKIVSDAKSILCNMTHRGATGADLRDGDGAGVMTAMPHEFLKRECEQLNFVLPPPGQYATGNVFLHPQKASAQKHQFESIALQQGLRVLGWREVPVDSTILGPVSKSKEPSISQPFVVLSGSVFDAHKFTKAVYLLRKIASHQIQLQEWFYICSLSTNNMVYKGQLSPIQVYAYFLDLGNHLFRAHFALVHSRFSTNTFPSWNRAQPLRFCAHNGEINTLRGNKNWMRAREGVMASTFFQSELEKLYPIIEEGGSDSAAFDNVLELLLVNGTLSLPEAVMMMVPEAWQSNPDMDPKRRAFYQWAACLMEPWDGPALFTFFDGRYAGANLDRNGLRPCRFYVTNDDRMICASEVGTISIDPTIVVRKGRLQPGHMLLVDTQEGRIVDSAELKDRAASRQDFGKWLHKQVILLDRLPKRQAPQLDTTTIQSDPRMGIFNFTLEQLNLLVLPMIRDGKEALGSMGNDGALACLSEQPRPIYDYFRQLFAQVTNPPIDPIREEIVMSLECFVGPGGNLLAMEESQCRRLLLPSPILSMDELATLRGLQEDVSDWPVATIPVTFPREEGEAGYRRALEEVCTRVAEQVQLRTRIIILSDRDVGPSRVPISALIALGAVHQHLVRNRQRSKVALVVETGEAREVHHFCALLGYGADAICPYLAIEAMLKLKREGLAGDASIESLVTNYRTATNNGILKVMSKMGISTLQSYKGAQIFEALGIGNEVVTRCFDGTASRIQGATFEIFAREALQLHATAYPGHFPAPLLPEVGEYHWRKGGEQHINSPSSIAHLQDAVRAKNTDAYEKYATECRNQIRACTLRGLMDFDFSKAKPVPLEEVESWTDIVKRFCTGAMSYGSISYESHSALAAAMNQLGGKSNTGEGGEDPERALVEVGGFNLRSAIKQVASGRFGVTSFYLTTADEIQIKMAQGAKPGEGGELPGHKVSQSIAKTRKSTPGVGLISPPPHHDIYSIEDLKQLIYDLKTANPQSRVSVKLVSEVGVGIVASGVAKAKADHILISGHDGGTGASRWTGIKHAGLPWELGLAETHQTLVLNDLRGRVVLQTDGQIKTGRDVALACLLGAEEWGFATAPLIAMGCIMMRKCHLNTCPVGIATQDPVLREKFAGQPEHVINFFHYVAEEMRSIMAALGFRRIQNMVGRADFLKLDLPTSHPKALSLDLSSLLIPAHTLRPGVATYCQRKQDHKLHNRLDNKLIAESSLSLKDRTPVDIDIDIVNTDRTLGSTLSYHISKTFGEEGLPADTIKVSVKGSAGQSFGGFLAPGVTLKLEGDANDYVGKGLSGGRIAIFPPKVSSFKSEENIIVGNVCLYGATSGFAFFRGMAAERFAVRNSGAYAVVEGVGDHGCEYMTGGRVVILGGVGRNFAAGMSGGIAYVLDPRKTLAASTNHEMVELEPVRDAQDIDELKELISEHYALTGSKLAQRILASFTGHLPQFTKVMPTDYKRALQEMKAQKGAQPVDEKSHKIHHQHAAIGDIEDSTQDKTNKPLDKVRGFVKYKRQGDPYRDPSLRLKDWKEVNNRLPAGELKVQAARCMDCGVPFCQSDTGCPIGNIIPKWNDLVFKGQWREALDRLMLTNNFPEFTGRVCPAPCEGACVLGINAAPVSIKSIECAIIDRGFQEGWIVPNPPTQRTDKRVAIIGSGPAGLAAADQLNKAGHSVTVYDRNDRAGGLLMYGIPNMKLDKEVVRRRLELLEAEGIQFVLNTHVGKDIPFSKLRDSNDVVLMATGATWPRDLPIPNRQLDGIHFAMDFLQKNTSALLDAQLTDATTYISAKDKHVVVIGGGDTGCDCIGTSARHGAASVTNFELLPQPPETRADDNPWPQFPRVFKVDYGHSEVQRQYARDPREYCVLSKEFVSDGKGNVKGIKIVRVQWTKGEGGKWSMAEVPDSEEFIRADLVLLAMGFLGPEADLVQQAGVETSRTSAIQTPAKSYATSVPGVFAAGDCRRGQSLIVWGINEGRQAAREIDQYLMGGTYLPVSGGILEPQSALSASLASALSSQPNASVSVQS